MTTNNTNQTETTTETTNNFQRRIKSAYYVGLGVFDWMTEKTTETVEYFEKKGQTYDKELATKFEERKKDFNEWQNKVGDQIKDEWKNLTTADGWKKRMETFNEDFKEFAKKVPFWKETEENASDTTETTDATPENAETTADAENETPEYAQH